MERHEAPRTVLRARCEAPYAVILPVQPVDVDLVDLHDYPVNEKASHGCQLAEEEAGCQISFSDFPLFRLTVVRLSAEQHVLLLMAHHEYVPCPYPGRIVLFQPKTHYPGYRDPLFGWGGIAQGGVDVHTLLVHPRGMLVRPFVQEPAREFQRALRDAGIGVRTHEASHE